MDKSLERGENLDKKDSIIHGLKEDVIKLMDDIKGKDEAVRALIATLQEKGDQNQKLVEKMTIMKNHQLSTQILN